MLIRHRTLASTAALLLPALTASAVTISNGQTITSFGTDPASRPELQGITLVSFEQGYYTLIPNLGAKSGSLFGPFGPAAGTLFTKIVRESATGTLDFYYSAAYTGGIDTPAALSISGIDPSLMLDVDFIGSAADTTSPGRPISFSGGSIFVQYPSLLIRTSLTDFNYTSGSVQIIFHMAIPGDTLTTFVPGGGDSPAGGAGVPEPAALALLPLALTSLVLRFYGRRG